MKAMAIPRPLLKEIDHRTLKLIVGMIAILLANVTGHFSETELDSISASYYERGWPHDFFVGSLFAIAAFLAAFNGRTRMEMALSKIAGIAALGVAIFPCRCGDRPEILPFVHEMSASVMFLVLAVFCLMFYRRALMKRHAQAKARAGLYAVCCLVILASIVTLLVDHLLHGAIKASIPRLVFYCERAGLVAFGVSWLAASHVLPLINRREERFSLFSSNEPPGNPN